MFDMEIWQGHYKEEKLSAHFPQAHRPKILNEILADQILPYKNRITHHDRAKFILVIQGRSTIQTQMKCACRTHLSFCLESLQFLAQITKNLEVFALIFTKRKKKLKKLEVNSSYIQQRIEVTGPPAALKSRDTGGRHMVGGKAITSRTDLNCHG